MPSEHLATYLNDHLAGSVVAVELLDHLEESHRGTEVESFVAGLRAEIESDRQTLKILMERLEIAESVARKASAWLAEKVTDLKLRLDDSAGGTFRLFESYEALSLGIEGKRLLWITLDAVAETEPGLRVFDYQSLARRAMEQRSRVDERRLEGARKALRTEAA